MKKVFIPTIWITTCLLLLTSCAGYKNFDITYELEGNAAAVDIHYTIKTKKDKTHQDIYLEDVTPPWTYSHVAYLWQNDDDEIYEEDQALITATKTINDSSTITARLYVNGSLVDEDSSSEPFAEVTVYKILDSF